MMGWNLKSPLVYVSSSVGIANVEEELDPLADFSPQWPLAVLHTNRAVSKGVDTNPVNYYLLCSVFPSHGLFYP